MAIPAKLKKELVELLLAWMYFVLWFGFLIALKTLTLVEYEIAFAGLSIALVSALILAKVVLIMEHIPLGKWVARRPAWVDVAARTLLYAVGVVVVLVIERGIEGRHEHGGFGASVGYVVRHADAHHILIDTLCATSALLGYNAITVVRQHLGHGGLARLFLAPPPTTPPGKR